jgi:transposase
MKTTKPDTAPPSFFLGIDVGKKDLFCHIITPEQPRSERFDNTSAGVKSLLKWVAQATPPAGLRACLEQTGHYGDLLANALHGRNIASLHLVNPRRIKAYGQQKLRRNKSDTADARLIAAFLKAEQHELRTWKPKSPAQQRVTELARHADSLVQDAARLKTRLSSEPGKGVSTSLQRIIRLLEKEIKSIRKDIVATIRADAGLLARHKLLKTIPGIGEVAAQTIIAELPELSEFEDARQLAAWSGLTPRHYQSGTSGKTQTPITKIGSVHLRRGLFMPAMTARQNNPLLKTFGDRLKENGKKPKQIIIAIMRKLLHQIYGILKSGLPYNPEKRGFTGAQASPL